MKPGEKYCVLNFANPPASNFPISVQWEILVGSRESSQKYDFSAKILLDVRILTVASNTRILSLTERQKGLRGSGKWAFLSQFSFSSPGGDVRLTTVSSAKAIPSEETDGIPSSIIYFNKSKTNERAARKSKRSWCCPVLSVEAWTSTVSSSIYPSGALSVDVLPSTSRVCIISIHFVHASIFGLSGGLVCVAVLPVVSALVSHWYWR